MSQMWTKHLKAQIMLMFFDSKKVGSFLTEQILTVSLFTKYIYFLTK